MIMFCFIHIYTASQLFCSRVRKQVCVRDLIFSEDLSISAVQIDHSNPNVKHSVV